MGGALDRAALAPSTGRLLGGRYRLARPLGSGGMGAVFAALDLRLGGEVAVKILRARAEPAMLERFRREARATASLGNPHIVRVTDFHENDGEPPFIVMERIEGVSLKSLVEASGRLPAERACSIAAQMLSALEDAHAAGILHRDIKPANVIVSSSPAGDLVKVVDFGLASLDTSRLTEPCPSSRMQLTAAGELVGTAGYVAPEHLRGEPLDGRADIYAVGATLFQMLTGRKPFDGMSLPYWMAVAQRASPVLDHAAFGVDPALAAVVHRAMAVQPSDRYASAREMMNALAPWTERRASQPPVSMVVPSVRVVPLGSDPPRRAFGSTPSATELMAAPRAAGSPVASRLVLIGIAVTVAVMLLFVARVRAAQEVARAGGGAAPAAAAPAARGR